MLDEILLAFSVFAKRSPSVVTPLIWERCHNIRDNKNFLSQVAGIFEDIRTSFQQLVKDSLWADEQTKISITEKLKKLKICIGFPNTFREPHDLESHYEIYNEVRVHVLAGKYVKNSCNLLKRACPFSGRVS